MTDKTELYEVFRGEGVSIEQMCAALPKLFDMFDNEAITLCPFPIFSESNGLGSNIIIIMHPELEDLMVFDYNGLIKERFLQ
jgi:hypothetical protein